MWITEYPSSALEKARKVYPPPVLTGMEKGIVALYQKCVHLGCRVPECKTSQWFECPCHGSQYNQVGEKKGGPAPRGLDRFAMEIDAADVLTVDTGNIILGPPIGTNTTGQEAEGPHCISEGAGGHGE
jgi:cytochrome b6-f complex iron-sulfur subunit